MAVDLRSTADPILDIDGTLARFGGDKNLFIEMSGIVLEGAFSVKGMPSFDGVVSKDQVEAIQQYVLSRAHATKP